MSAPPVPPPQDRPVRVVCLGETMLMLAPSAGERLETAAYLRPYLGGAESNVAIGLARLGAEAAWIGKLPRTPLARRIVHEMRAEGVDTSSVVWCETGRLGLFFFEFAAPPRPQICLYDREHSSAGTLTAVELDWERIGGADWIHLTGITPALGPVAQDLVRDVLRRARAIGLHVSFDVNYRQMLWAPEQAREVLRSLLCFVDLLVATEEDAALLLDRRDSPEAALQNLYDNNGHQAVILTLGDRGAAGFDGRSFYRSSGFAAQVVNRLGAGDAFAAGLLYGYSNGGLEAGLRYGSAMAALKLTIPQNTPLIDRAEVERLLAGDGPGLLR